MLYACIVCCILRKYVMRVTNPSLLPLSWPSILLSFIFLCPSVPFISTFYSQPYTRFPIPMCHPAIPFGPTSRPQSLSAPMHASLSGEANTDVATVAKPAKFQSTVDCKPIVGQVTWKPSKKCWEVIYKNSKKEQCVEAIYLEDGDFKETRKRAYDTAVSFWNEHDTSTRARIQ